MVEWKEGVIREPFLMWWSAKPRRRGQTELWGHVPEGRPGREVLKRGEAAALSWAVRATELLQSDLNSVLWDTPMACISIS